MIQNHLPSPRTGVRNHRALLYLLILVSVAGLAPVPLNEAATVAMFGPAAFSNGMPSSLVLGQATFNTANLATTATGLFFPRTAAFDSLGNLWVADESNNRVLRYSPPFISGMAANLVIGQSGFATNIATTTQTGLHGPVSVAFDSFGNLWVTDRYDNRILRYNPPFISGMPANLVIGQSTFTANAAVTSQTGLTSPWNIAFDSSGLWVADDGNNRVLRFPGPTFANGMAANLVIGQSGYTSGLANHGGPVSATGLSAPEGVAFDSIGQLWVADQANNRVLRFSAPFVSGMAANLALGQPGLSTNTPATTATGEFAPIGITFDSSGDLWVAEASGNNRVIRYPSLVSTTSTSGTSANLVIGQTVFTTNIAATSQTGLRQPEGVAFDSSGNLWVVDQGNHRILSYQAGTPPTTKAGPFWTYRVKFICNLPPRTPNDAERIGLVPGEYKTDINVHNRNSTNTVNVTKKFVVSVPEPATPGAIVNVTKVAFLSTQLKPDAAFYIDCREILSLLYPGQAAPPTKGWVILTTNTTTTNPPPLDVWAEYTAQSYSVNWLPIGSWFSYATGISLDVQQIKPEPSQ